ncbi:hypothetical protein [Aquabacterium sp. OR-4]|uniref:hypothetical protein n=1 Tax=Aquabacterium sp. OR-4 TaxID=2978127 RepID=UPI0028CA9E5C|nr:hypothetical protein [Aquabacterium sp. OR-4]MDT7838255.1 hypothetical protein [Aquabacterium sp. OR-4]
MAHIPPAHSTLATYSPPALPRTVLAVGTAPLLVLLVFTLVVLRVMDVDTALACLAACAVWVATEMHGWQRATDRYNAEYVQRHLIWRSSDTLLALSTHEYTNAETRVFVLRYLAAGRVLRPDGPLAQ